MQSLQMICALGILLVTSRVTVKFSCSHDMFTFEEASTMDVNVRVNDPREHINEEPRNDFGDLMMGFVGMFGFMTIIFFGFVIIKFLVG